MTLRLATRADADAIEAIYASYVLTSTCTWQEQPGPPEERRAWLDAHGERHPVTVVEEAGEIVAWGALSPFNRRSGYRFTVEDSVYVRADRQRRGLGRLVLEDLLRRARALEHHTVVAGISADQEGSLRLHAAFGFVEVARMPELGYKLGSWLDLVYLQLTLPGGVPGRSTS